MVVLKFIDLTVSFDLLFLILVKQCFIVTMETVNSNSEAELIPVDGGGVAESLSFIPAPPGNIYRNPGSIVEISSLLGEMYIDSQAEESDDVAQPVVKLWTCQELVAGRKNQDP